MHNSSILADYLFFAIHSISPSLPRPWLVLIHAAKLFTTALLSWHCLCECRDYIMHEVKKLVFFEKWRQCGEKWHQNQVLQIAEHKKTKKCGKWIFASNLDSIPSIIYLSFFLFFFVKLTPSSLFDLSRKHSVRSSEITSTSDAGAGIIAVLQRLWTKWNPWQ